MATDEKLQRWLDAVDRVILAGKTVSAAIKLFQEGGPTAEIAFDAVEKSREALGSANRHEGIAWKQVMTAKPQTSIPGMEAPGPEMSTAAAQAASVGGMKLLTGPKLEPGLGVSVAEEVPPAAEGGA